MFISRLIHLFASVGGAEVKVQSQASNVANCNDGNNDNNNGNNNGNTKTSLSTAIVGVFTDNNDWTSNNKSSPSE